MKVVIVNVIVFVTYCPLWRIVLWFVLLLQFAQWLHIIIQLNETYLKVKFDCNSVATGPQGYVR